MAVRRRVPTGIAGCWIASPSPRNGAQPFSLAPRRDRWGQLLGFRHVVRHLYADDLDPLQVRQRLDGAVDLWPHLSAELSAFERWLKDLIALADKTGRYD